MVDRRGQVDVLGAPRLSCPPRGGPGHPAERTSTAVESTRVHGRATFSSDIARRISRGRYAVLAVGPGRRCRSSGACIAQNWSAHSRTPLETPGLKPNLTSLENRCGRFRPPWVRIPPPPLKRESEAFARFCWATDCSPTSTLASTNVTNTRSGEGSFPRHSPRSGWKWRQSRRRRDRWRVGRPGSRSQSSRSLTLFGFWKASAGTTSSTRPSSDLTMTGAGGGRLRGRDTLSDPFALATLRPTGAV
jgi:hypothetical protein